VRESQPRISPELPCKNVDFQTQGYWANANSYDGGYRQTGLVKDAAIMEALCKEALRAPVANPAAVRAGWFFSIPQPEPPVVDGSPPIGRREMMRSETLPNGAVINLNPSSFGEVYWVGGDVGGTFMAFAVWLPYEPWPAGPLPVIVHFRPNYTLPIYADAQKNAKVQRVPVVLARVVLTEGGRKGEKIQPFLDAAWYYFLGPLAFAQQMIAVRRLAALVMPIPPPTTEGILHPEPFFKSFRATVVEVVNRAIERASATPARKVAIADTGFILSANSHGGLYLMHAARLLMQSKLLKEVWMFDTDISTMREAKAIAAPGVIRRIYVAQSEGRGLVSGGVGNDFERQVEGEWSVVDISRIPNHGTSLHDFCGRVCFSHAAALSPALTTLRNPAVMDKTLTTKSCWENRQEFWRRHSR
jgi:hypothetical protein